jgi:probable phosphoglycerate mutase
VGDAPVGRRVEQMSVVVDVVSLVFAAVGAVASVWFVCDKLCPVRKLSWRHAEKAAQMLAEMLGVDGYSPTVIVGIGRGGAIFGAMVSGCLGHRPLLVIDRKYTWVDGRRMDGMVLRLRLPPELVQRVLLVAGEAHTGNTMRLYYDHFQKIGAGEVRRAALFYQTGCTEPIEYIGFAGAKDLRMPWMFTKRYARESRAKEEARGLSTIESTVEGS